MTDDLLKAATRALREESESDSSADGRFTRARVMASLHQGTVKRRTRLAFVLPLAACLAAGTAWAGATGKLPAVFEAITNVVRGTPPDDAREPPPKAAAPKATAKPSAPRSEAAPSPPPTAPSSERLPEAPVPSPRPKAEPVLPARPSSSAAFSDRDGDLYRLAHDAHFASHDYARALLAWDDYLRAAPSGRLATEARFNRAICLLRLGRVAEARTALKPFALGAMGYRQSEAQQLLDELPE